MPHTKGEKEGEGRREREEETELGKCSLVSGWQAEPRQTYRRSETFSKPLTPKEKSEAK